MTHLWLQNGRSPTSKIAYVFACFLHILMSRFIFRKFVSPHSRELKATKPISQENKFWQKAEDLRIREEAVLRREETVQQREDKVLQRVSHALFRSTGYLRCVGSDCRRLVFD
jgi:hypothetical protein